MARKRPLAATIFFGITSVGLAACGNFFVFVSTLGPAKPGTVVLSLSLRDTPPAGVTLLSAAVTITGAVMQPGSFPLLSTPIRVQLKKLETETAVLATTRIPTGIFAGLNLTFANPEFTILNNSGFAIGACANGAICQIKPTLNPASVFIPSALILSSGTPVGEVLDLDLNRSLGTDLSFSPSLRVREAIGLLGTSALEDVNDFVGEVTEIGATQFTVRSDSSGQALTIQVDGTASFAGFNLAGLPNSFAGLRMGQGMAVDLRLLADGTLLARRVELEERAGAQAVEGVMVTADPINNRFSLVVLDEVPSITGVAVGQQVTVSVEPGASFEIGDDGLTLPVGVSFSRPADLLVGQEVHARAISFSAGSSGVSLVTDRVRLRMGQFTAQVGAKSGNNFTVTSLPSLFATPTPGIAEIQVETFPETEFENVPAVGSFNTSDTVSLRGLLFRASASPILAAKKVRKR